MNTKPPGLPGRWFPQPGVEELSPTRAAPAFLPDPLPSEVTLRQDTYRMVADAQEAVGRLDMAARQAPNPMRWTRHALREEARAWAAFDGVVTLPQEAYVLGRPGAPPADARLGRYVEACAMVMENAARGRPIDVALLTTLSREVTGAPDGQEMWRTGPAGNSLAFPTAPTGPELFVATEQWCEWMDGQREMPLLVKCGLAFFQYSVLSPFPGADHVARAVVTYETLRSGTVHESMLPISAWMRRYHQMIPGLIRGVIERQDFDALVMFLATCVQEACEAQVARIEAARSTYAMLADQFSRKTAVQRVLEALVAGPAMDLQEIAEVGEITVTHAATLARQLKSDGIVQILDSRTLEHQAESNSYRKIVQFDPTIMRRLNPPDFQPPPRT